MSVSNNLFEKSHYINKYLDMPLENKLREEEVKNPAPISSIYDNSMSVRINYVFASHLSSQFKIFILTLPPFLLVISPKRKKNQTVRL